MAEIESLDLKRVFAKCRDYRVLKLVLNWRSKTNGVFDRQFKQWTDQFKLMILENILYGLKITYLKPYGLKISYGSRIIVAIKSTELSTPQIHRYVDKEM